MNARAALYRHVREFIETQLVGLVTAVDLSHIPARPAAPKREGGRKFAFGKEQEIVEVRFGDYDLVVESPLEAPPLGRVTLRWPEGELAGPIDRTTFERAGAKVRERGVTPERIAV